MTQTDSGNPGHLTEAGELIWPGDIVLVEHRPGWTSAVIIGMDEDEYYYLPKEYEWGRLESGGVPLRRASIDSDSARFLALLGTVMPALVMAQRKRGGSRTGRYCRKEPVMTTYVNWDIGGLVEIQDAVGPNGPVLLITMSQYNNIYQITYPVEKRTEVEIALANKSFVALA